MDEDALSSMKTVAETSMQSVASKAVEIGSNATGDSGM
jgi:hypothetical protein